MRNWGSRATATAPTALLIAAFAFADSAGAEEASTERIRLDPAVASQLAPHVAPRTSAPMPSLLETHSIDARGNFGLVSVIRDRVRRRVTDNGLYEIETSNSGAEGNGTVGKSASLSLCGFLPLLAVSDSRIVTTLTGASPVGGVMEMRFSSDAASRLRILRLDSSAPSLCNLSPGDEFSLRTEAHMVLHQKGRLIRDKSIQISNTGKRSCRAVHASKPASAIAPFLTGDYHEVSCENVDGKGQSTSSTWAYLTDYHYYLALEAKSKGGRTTITYSALDPKAP